MGFTSAGLPNNGRTAHYQIAYDDALATADGHDRALGLMNTCEADFTLMASWFSGVNFEFNFPLPVQIANASGGASWNDPPDIAVAFGTSPTVTLKPGPGTSVNFLRYLLVSEVTEMFMASQKKGWYQDTSLFSGADEGSKGEGLSRFLGVQFQLANGLGNVPPAGFGITAFWINSSRLDFVNVNPDDNQPDATNGCTTLFLYYLRDQLGHSVNSIIGAGSSTLAGVYQTLTGKTDGWASFSGLVNSCYPQGFTYSPAADTIFPVPTLTQFLAPNQITTGYTETTQIFIDRPAPAQVNIALKSDDPLVSVPSTVTIQPGQKSATVSVHAGAIAIPFATKSVNVHATYAGKTLTMTVEVVPPRVVSLVLNPSTVTCGDSSTATVTLDRPSLLRPVVVDLICGAPGFATLPGPTLTIPQGVGSMGFTITTPKIAVAFKTAQASIYATYSGSSASATLTVKSKVVAGILNSLVLFPTSVAIGGTSTGTVTLIEAVPTDTVVGVAALDSGVGPGGNLPLPGNASQYATVPASITIPAGKTSGSFAIHTHGTVTSGTTHIVRIMAGAVATKYAALTIT